ncbi:uncharacterized protein N7484_004541 [Penicillium longicatenatum]|uniref:uncharacterized protein n=1 Tax=Penicillium longicatenatum TaxID=1561947 RepID=UPI0025499B65|nr:uncharacterized protein N7484_004541 [Penicillium longicatenatum]KAJ5650818.1 hypothetical protein N7484_004541 [Penicillium longicatenatum]
MKTVFAIAAFAAGTNALVGRSDSCCFHLTASGSLSGSLGQLSDGQVRLGDDSLSAADFCINSSGAITDSEGRGCIVTSETTQFQCDTGANATTGFSINSNGGLEYHNSPRFIACETGQNNGRNIYTTNSTSVTMCKNIELTADSCSGSGAGASSSPKPSASASASSIPVAPSSSAATPAPSSPAPVYTSPAASAPSAPAPVNSSPTAGSAPAPSAATLSGSPIYVTSTVTVTDCSCANTTPGLPVPSGGAGSAPSGSPAPSYSQAPAPSGSSPSESAQPSGPIGGSTPSASAAPSPSQSVQPSAPAGGFSTSASPVESVAPTTSSMVAPAPSTTAVQSSASSTATQSSASSCATTLTSGEYQYPHLIIPINSSTPDTAYGTQYFGTVRDTVSTIFNFDIPSSYEGSTCNLVFMFPQKADLETSDYTFSGDGKIDFSKLSEVASSSTTYNNAPSVSEDLGDITISAGNSYVVSSFSCPAGETVAYEMSEAGTTDLYWFNDWNPSPLGLFITKC